MNRFRESLTIQRVAEEFITWNTDEMRFGHMQRFGQRMVNKYLLRGCVAPDIFYEPDGNLAYGKLVKEILDNEKLPASLSRQALA